jgi:hypothetical protein
VARPSAQARLAAVVADVVGDELVWSAVSQRACSSVHLNAEAT